MSSDALQQLLPDVVALARQAGKAAMAWYHAPETTYKQDGSPITRADKEADAILQAGLARLTPDILIVSEEGDPALFDAPLPVSGAWLIDPIDGTKGFVRKTGDFAVHVGLVIGLKPVLGVVYAPALDIAWFAAAGCGAFRQEGESAPVPIHVAPVATPLRVALSRDEDDPRLDNYVATLPSATVIRRGSSIKTCLLAEGKVDVYPRGKPSMEWDTAAPQCILEEAGGRMILHGGASMPYGKPGLNNTGYVCVPPGIDPALWTPHIV